MRGTTLTLACVLVASATSLAHADGAPTVWAKRDTQLHARPGEASTAIGRVQSGERLVVVGTQGRWLRVRHRQRTGWVTRTQVEERGDRATRKRRQATGFSGKQREDALKVVVEIDRVRAFDDPRTKAKEVLDLKRGDQLVVLGRGHEGWILVESEGAGVGWIPESAVTDGGKFTRDPRRAPTEVAVAEPATDEAPTAAKASSKASIAASVDDDDAETPAAPSVAAAPATATKSLSSSSKPRWTAGAGLGAGVDSFGLRQEGTRPALGTTFSPAASVEASGAYRITDTLWVGGGVDAVMSTGSMTLNAQGAETTGIKVAHMAVMARAELTYAPSWQVSGRVGWHYNDLSVDSELNEDMLLGETAAGPTFGVGGGYPINDRFAVMAAVDVAPLSVQAPKERPQDFLYGTSMTAAWATAAGTVKLPWRLTGALAYRFGMASLELTNGAATPAAATRTDQSHTVTAGVRLAW